MDTTSPFNAAEEANESLSQPYIRQIVRPQHSGDGRKLRFAVLLREQPVIVNVDVFIDGHSFLALHEQLVEECVAFSASQRVGGEKQAHETLFPNSALAKPELFARLASYIRVTERIPAREEIRWLLGKWQQGPAVLRLRDAFRSSLHCSPVFDIIDTNSDRLLSADEIQHANERLRATDANGDDILGLVEMREYSKAASWTTWQPRRLLLPMDNDAWAAAELAKLYSDQWTTDQLASLTPDLLLDVRFNRNEPEKSTIRVIASDPRIFPQPLQQAARIDLEIAGTVLSISAAQISNAQEFSEVSLGALPTSDPLLGVIDSNGDGRLTLRELRLIGDKVMSLDRGSDDQLALEEIPQRIRLGVGLGPIIHRHLTESPPARFEATDSPSWFNRMDRNSDDDITREEFLGDKQQFDALDANGDGFISGAEAVPKREK